MTAIQDWGGSRWFAGVMLAVLFVSMGQGFATPVHAEEGDTSSSAEQSSDSTNSPASTVDDGEEKDTDKSDSEPSDTTSDESVDTTSADTEKTADTTSTEEETLGEEGEEGEEGVNGEPNTEEEVTEAGENGEDGDPSEPGEQGEEGDNGETAGEEPPSDGAPAVIDTGNATSSSNANTGANTTDIDTNVPSSTASSTSDGDDNEDTNGSNGGGDTDVELGNGLTASTTASSTASTGENAAVDPDGVNIFTGDGVASVFDVLTFNIALVNSNGQIMLLQNPLAGELDLREKILNVFRNLTGAEGTCTLTVCEATDALFNYIGDNVADVERNTYAGCNSGENVGDSSNGIVLIDTGDCTGSNLTVTIGDLTAVESQYLIILMNQVGDLSSDIILPEPSFFESLRGGASMGQGSSLAATSTADVTNNATSTASSGSNNANGEDFSGVMSGGADAHAFVGNYANQINPPTCFIISVGGEWNGDIYQMPDGYDRETTPYADIICGRGAGASNGVQGYNLTQTNYAKVLVNAIAEATTGGNTATGQEAVIRSGDAQSFLNVLNILNTTLISQDWLFGLFTISGDWNGDFSFGARPDASPAEQAASQMISKKKAKPRTSMNSQVELIKTASVSSATIPSTVDYTLTLKNNGGRIYGAVLEDVMSDPNGTVMNTQKWDLDTILAGEEIVIKYSVEFAGNLTPGEYLNAARLTGRANTAKGTPIKPVYTSMSIQLGGEVLGAMDCPAYLTDYIIPGRKNNPEQVRLLEVFLRDGRGENITPDGIYDALSIDAIKRFQAENTNDILSPWGIEYPTGHVYYTTKKKINELYCNGGTSFPLSPLQVDQMELYRNGDLQDSSVGAVQAPHQWSGTLFPLFADLNVFPSITSPQSAPATGPGFFSTAMLNTHPLLTLLRDIFSQIASGFSIERAQASEYSY